MTTVTASPSSGEVVRSATHTSTETLADALERMAADLRRRPAQLAPTWLKVTLSVQRDDVPGRASVCVLENLILDGRRCDWATTSRGDVQVDVYASSAAGWLDAATGTPVQS